jgi:hypothetical protein
MIFSVEIASVPDREDLVAEIWLGNEMVAEMQRKPDGCFLLELYPRHHQNPWSFELQDWMEALSEARRRLLILYSSGESDA